MNLRSKIKLIEISESFGLGGSEQAIQVRTELISKDLFDPLVIAFNEGGPRLDEIRKQNIQTLICNGNLNLLETTIRDFSPHILSYYRGKSNSGLIKAISEIAHKIDIPLVVETNHFGRLGIENLSRKPDINIHVSLSSFFKYFRQINSPLQVSLTENAVIYNPVPISKFSKCIISSVIRSDVRKKYGINDNQLLACRISRPDLRKWSSVLETALPFILKLNPSLKIIFMAAPPVKEKILKKKFGNRLIFIPPTSSVRTLSEIYQISDFMLHSSGIGESFGLSIAEGMYWNLPVIVDSTPKLDNAQIELVDHNINGIVVNSSQAFAKAVHYLIKNDGLIKKMGNHAKNKVISRFADVLTTKQWEKVYIDALAKKINLSDELIQYSKEIELIPEANEYENFEEEYQLRLNNLWYEKDDLKMKLKQKYLQLNANITYAKQMGWHSVIDVVKARMDTGSMFKRV